MGDWKIHTDSGKLKQIRFRRWNFLIVWISISFLKSSTRQPSRRKLISLAFIKNTELQLNDSSCLIRQECFGFMLWMITETIISKVIRVLQEQSVTILVKLFYYELNSCSVCLDNDLAMGLKIESAIQTKRNFRWYFSCFPLPPFIQFKYRRNIL